MCTEAFYVHKAQVFVAEELFAWSVRSGHGSGVPSGEMPFDVHCLLMSCKSLFLICNLKAFRCVYLQHPRLFHPFSPPFHQPTSLTLHSGDQYIHCCPVCTNGRTEFSLLLLLHGSCYLSGCLVQITHVHIFQTGWRQWEQFRVITGGTGSICNAREDWELWHHCFTSFHQLFVEIVVISSSMTADNLWTCIAV